MAEQPNRHDGHLVVYVAWPILAGLGVGAVLALSVGGVALLWTRLDWLAAGTWAAGTFFVVLGVVTAGVFMYATADWTGPRRAERIERSRREVVQVRGPEPEPRFIPITTKRPLRRDPPALPSSVEERGLVGKAIDVLSDRMKTRAAVTTYDQDAETLEPDARPWVREMYRVVCASWPDHLTRRDWQRLFPDGGTALWARYVNGDGSGRRAKRGVLATWGAIERVDGRGAWRYTQPLDVVFSLDPELQRYAEARSGLVRSPGRPGATGNAARTGTEPNQTNDQTKHRKGGR
ncbi:MAG TPA: hypothetical protein VMY40_10035 [Anaerolineae bacterium]|nr:hypothetical protein [Anaerolineae bacterium]